MTDSRERAKAGAALDATDRALLVALSREGRRSGADLAKDLAISRQAVAERLKDLERRQVIRGYRADVDPAALGLGVRAQIRIALLGSAGPGRQREVVRVLAASPLVRSVYRVSGEDCFVVQLVCRQIADVNGLLAQLQATRAVQASHTSFVLETLVEKGGLGPLEPALVGAEETP